MRIAVRAIIVRDQKLLVMHRNKFGQQYYTLPGGGIDIGETPEQALVRELREETSLSISQPRLVFVEQPGEPFGDQYIYLCEGSGELALSPQSEEAKVNALGQNLHEPQWLPVSQLPEVLFMSRPLQHALIQGLANGWPAQAVRLEAVAVNSV